MSKSPCALSVGRSSSTGLRASRALLQLTLERVREKTTLGRVFMTTAIGLWELAQASAMSS